MSDQQGDISMKSNFGFLESHFPVLANFGELAEKYLYSDPNSCLIKLGMIGEIRQYRKMMIQKFKI